MIEEIESWAQNFTDMETHEVRGFYEETLGRIRAIEEAALRTVPGEAFAEMMDYVSRAAFALEELTYAYAVRYHEAIHDQAVMPAHLIPGYRPHGTTPPDFVTQDQINTEITAHVRLLYPATVPTD